MLRCFFFAILILFSLAAAILFAVDLVFYLKNRYCRFHIGRWNDFSIWQHAVEQTAKRWLKHTPTVKITDNSRYMLLDFFNGTYRSHTIQSWQKAALILSLWESGEAELMEYAQKYTAALLNSSGNWIQPPVAVDCGLLSYAVLLTNDAEHVRPAMEYSLKIIENHIHKSNMICYTGGNQNPEMYVDTLGLVCPFLMLYAEKYQKPEWADLAIFQLKTFHQYGMLPGTALPNHAFNIISTLPLGVYGWGRGVGWYLIGLTESYAHIQNSEQKELLKVLIQEAAHSYCRFQRTDGGFGSILQRMDTYDSSATAVLAWFYFSCANWFDHDINFAIGNKCLSKLKDVTRITGAIDLCQGDTKGIGTFAQTYDIMPFAQGMALRAIYLRQRNVTTF